ncbi:roadblock/LC7 domain-containing protein [Kineosporia sp. A_224]|uniref:roadblock/LC7 domain-containing protein n=1 Tax=Kineosporia sp. A_224 TaxID=1962180 RepID=UPI001E3FCCAA|nr:roadblock/LC7 domain-containing protein [Kineosporia sp. A_224]
MTGGVSAGQGLDWLLDDLVERLPGADRAIVLSADGLLIGRSQRLSKDDADHLSAVASGFHSLAKGTGRHFDGGGVRQTLVEMDRAWLIVTAAGPGAAIALIADDQADMGMVAYEMNVLVRKVGPTLSAARRRPSD